MENQNLDNFQQNDPNKKNQFESNKKYFTISIYALFVIAIGALLFNALNNLDGLKKGINNIMVILAPFIAAFFIAYILNPIVVRIRKFLKQQCKIKSDKITKGLAIFISYFFVLSLITITINYVVPEIGRTIADLTNKLPTIYDGILDYISNLEKHFPEFDFAFIESQIKASLPKLMSIGTNLVTNAIPWVFNVSFSIVKVLINVVLSVVISCYMLADKKIIATNMKKFTYAILPVKKADYFCQTSRECNLIFTRFIVGKTIDSLIIGVLCFILMSVLQLEYSLLISIIVGITNMIPYFGPFIGAIPGVLLYLFVNPIHALIFTIMIFALQQFDGLYLGPKILGESTGLTPLWVIFGITVGGAFWGPLGMFLGVPIMGVISHLLNKFVNMKLKKKNISSKFE